MYPCMLKKHLDQSLFVYIQSSYAFSCSKWEKRTELATIQKSLAIIETIFYLESKKYMKTDECCISFLFETASSVNLRLKTPICLQNFLGRCRGLTQADNIAMVATQ